METLLFFPLDSPYHAAYRCNAPEDPVGPHSHNGAELYLTLSPLRDVLIEDRVFAVSEYTLIIIPPFCVHQLYHESGVCYERYVLNITDSWLRNIFGADAGIPSALLNKGTPMLIDLKEKKGCNRQVLFHKFRQIIFHNPRHLRFHSPRHFIFHTCHYAVSSKNDFLFSSL